MVTDLAKFPVQSLKNKLPSSWRMFFCIFLVQGPRKEIIWFYLSCRSLGILSRNVCTNPGWCRTLSSQCGGRPECLCDSVQYCIEFWKNLEIQNKTTLKQQLNGDKLYVERKTVAIETILCANICHCGLGIKNQLSICLNSLLGRVWCIWQADQWLPLILKGWFLVLESTLNASSCTICAPLTRWLSKCVLDPDWNKTDIIIV